MKKAVKNEIDILDLINKIQTQIIELDKKISTLIDRSIPQAKPSPTTAPKERTMHTAICADCKKECTIPFKPSGDRPVYCQDCFSRRKVIRLSKMGIEQKPQINIQEPTAKPKKKPVTTKKPNVKKKATPKKK